MIVYFDIEKVNETVKIDIQRPSEGKQHAKKYQLQKNIEYTFINVYITPI